MPWLAPTPPTPPPQLPVPPADMWQLLPGNGSKVACGLSQLLAVCTSYQDIYVMTGAHAQWILCDGQAVRPVCSAKGDFYAIQADGKVRVRVPVAVSTSGEALWMPDGVLNAVLIDSMSVLNPNAMITVTKTGQCLVCFQSTLRPIPFPGSIVSAAVRVVVGVTGSIVCRK